MTYRNPQQRGEFYQTLCRARTEGRAGIWSVLDLPLQVGSFNNTTGFFSNSGQCHPGHAWLTVSLHARELQRYFARPPGSVQAVPQSTLINDTQDPRLMFTLPEVAANPESSGQARSSSVSLLQARITWTDDTATQTQVIVDVAGGYIGSFFSRHARVEFLLPQESIAFTQIADPANPPSLSAGAGLYLDSFLEASYSASETAPVGQPLGKRTGRSVLAAGGQVVCKVPDQAQAVSVYGNEIDASWLIEPALPAGVMPLRAPTSGLRPFDIGSRQDRPGDARYLLMTNTGAAVADVAAVWELGL